MATRSFWSKVRLIFLLMLLLAIALNAYLSRVRSTDWNDTLWLVIYPVNADNRADTQRYLNALQPEHFADIETFFIREAARYGITAVKPIEVKLAPPVAKQPPKPPRNASVLESVIWSLHLRYWGWKNNTWKGVDPDIKMYLRLFSPQNRQVLEHSLGLQKGMIGVVNGFASIDYQAQNNFVTVHETLHTLGASDKYALETNQPIWPQGYADPRQIPLFPQYRAEAMGGRVPQTETLSLMPENLEQVVVGPETAAEINWIEPK